MKVFGIGLPRTGTRSLLCGLQTLGLRVRHAMHLSRSSLDDADAFADTPIWCDWPLLAETYPDSKFILTTRDKKAWFESFKRRLGPFYNQILMDESTVRGGPRGVDLRCYRTVFQSMPLRQSFFGAIYDQHERTARDTLSSQRLLVIDVSESGALKKVSEFLGLEPVDFPNVNQLAQIGGGHGTKGHD